MSKLQVRRHFHSTGSEIRRKVLRKIKANAITVIAPSEYVLLACEIVLQRNAGNDNTHLRGSGTVFTGVYTDGGDWQLLLLKKPERERL